MLSIQHMKHGPIPPHCVAGFQIDHTRSLIETNDSLLKLNVEICIKAL